MTFYADYVSERLGHCVLETKHGFATYTFPDEKTVYIIDIYIAPDFRQLKYASDMADTIKELAKKRGCTKMIGSVMPSSKNSTTSLKVLLGYEMKLEFASHDAIWLYKEI